MSVAMRGNCYVASEVLYHLLGGARAGWKPMRMHWEGDSHWYLQHKSGMILDPTAMQFQTKPDYSKGIGCGFLTKKPSKRAQALIELMVWQ